MLARKIMAMFTAFVLVVGLWPAVAVANVDEGLVAASLAAADSLTEDEPNDLQEEATELPANVVMSGEVYNETSSSRFVGVTDYYDDDYFKFTLASPSQVSISLSADVVMGREADWLVSPSGVKYVGYESPLFDVDLTREEAIDADDSWDYTMSPSDTKKWQSGNLYLAAGTYYLRIAGNSSSNMWGEAYELTLNCATALNSEVEPNDTFSQASDLQIGTAYAGSFYAPGSSNDSDFYKFTLSTPASIAFNLGTDVVLDGSDSALDFSVCTQASFETTEKFDYIMYPEGTKKWVSDVIDLPAGTHYLRVDIDSSYDDAWGHDYELKASFATKTYMVEFDANGGTGKMEDQEIECGKATPLAPSTFTRKGYEFVGWNTDEYGEETSYKDGQIVTDLADYDETVVLYAQWVEAKYEVKFMANGGSGSMAAQAIYRGKSTNLNANAFTRAGYKFKGWNTKANGSGIAFKNKQKVINLARSGRRVKLYAQWELVKTIKVAGFSLKLPQYWQGKVTYSTSKNNGVYNVGTLTHVVDKKSGSLVVIHCAKKKKFKRMSGWGNVVGIGKKTGKRYKVEVYMLEWPWMTRGAGSRHFDASSLKKADRAIQMVTGGKCKSCGLQGTKSFKKSRTLAAKYLKKNIVKQIKVS